MDEKCKDCVYIANLQNEINDIKGAVKNMDDRLREVEKTNEARDVQINTIFGMLKKIEISVEKIADKIESIQLAPASLVQSTIVALITAVISVAVTVFITGR